MLKILKKAMIATAVFSITLCSAAFFSTDAKAAENDTVSVYKLYNSISGESLLSTDANEIRTLAAYGFVNEGVFMETPTSGVPVYRLFHSSGKHAYSACAEEVANLVYEGGWTVDNNGQPVFYSGGDVAVYRMYDPDSEHHLYTSSPYVHSYQNVYGGWHSEYVAFHAAATIPYPETDICIY